MPKFAANLTTMFREFEMAERFEKASQCGFKGVEILSPYEWPIEQLRQWLKDTGLEFVLTNTKPGENQFGTAAIPGLESQFRSDFEETLEYASALDCKLIHFMAGRSAGEIKASASLFIEHARWAADLAAANNITLMLEPINHRDVPGYLHAQCDETTELITMIGKENVALQFDFYHAQLSGGNLTEQIRRHFSMIRHVQFSSVPGRHEPQFGEINVHYLFSLLEEYGYEGWIGCEYTAQSDTLSGLTWAERYNIAP